MELPNEKEINHGNNAFAIGGAENATIYRMHNATGEGTMTYFHVFPGINLQYNDIYMQSCRSRFRTKAEMLCIDHCHEGRIEWEYDNGSYSYLQEGELQIDTKAQRVREFSFPLKHYHGITVAIFIEEAKKTLADTIGGIPVNLDKIKEKFCTGAKPFIMRSSDSAQQIFSELYRISDKIRIPYLKIKVLELLLFLSEVPDPNESGERPYFSKAHVETIKSMTKFIVDNLERHFSMAELSDKFQIPLTSMKNCFKGVYGTPIYTYMRTYRIQTAAFLLRQTRQSVTSVAENVGYRNPSKFSSAFKEVMGISPFKYRKSSV